MAVDLAGTSEGIPERFVPDKMRGELVEAEHLARYHWASALATGRRVLDAGCGMGYGATILAAEGASKVVGVDIAEGVVEAARALVPEAVTLEVHDLRDLPYEADSFDVIACFEVIEHLEDAAAALDELARVLTPDGVFLVSSPNRGTYPPGNPHHLHEFRPEELRATLSERWRNVGLMRQHPYLASAILSDELFSAAAAEPVEDLTVRKLVGAEPGEETYTLAIATGGELPEMPNIAAMTADLELRGWLEVFQEHDQAVRGWWDRTSDLERQLEVMGAADQRLIEAEHALADLPDLRLELERARADVADAHARVADAEARLRLNQDELNRVSSSFSWRVTRPLRAAKGLLRRGSA